ncbi:PE domain-containing protein [Lentzea sp.]|uniref:PE domain-containing protein n=1 Tax=Lentzea sp. TaxID=56099 RepID=UPI002C38B8C3|nr:PE domain-containing protein [Lentzea sp.]HUQ58600.1 PE domain-containing protein [Lentzea sp.]
MPFMATTDGGGPGAGVTMRIEPGEILKLKAKYEAVRDTVRDFLDRERDNLRGRPLAEDDVSQDAAKVFQENAGKAIEVTVLFLDELERNIRQLDAATKTYDLVEDTNYTSMQQQNRGL